MLEVRLYGENIGTLRRQGAGSVFVASEEWRWARFQPMLGLSWLQDTGPRRAEQGLPSWFAGLLPDENTPLRDALALDKGLHPSDSLGILAAVGSDLPGAVRIGGQPEDGPDPTRDEVKPPTGNLHFSLAGAQIKFSLSLREEKLVLPVHGEEGWYIAKVASEKYVATPHIEHLTMQWAARCGHETAPTRLVPLRDIPELHSLEEHHGEQCLVVQRFDRSPEGPIHQEDLCQVFSLDPRDRYSEHDPHRALTYGGLTRFVRDALGDEAAIEFARRVAFALASGNTDAHLQNWSIVLPKSGPLRLAPLYDQLAVIAFAPFGWSESRSPSMALPFGSHRAMARIDRDALAQFAIEAADSRLVRVFTDALVHAREVWRELEPRALRPHRDAIEAQWANVPLLAALR